MSKILALSSLKINGAEPAEENHWEKNSRSRSFNKEATPSEDKSRPESRETAWE